MRRNALSRVAVDSAARQSEPHAVSRANRRAMPFAGAPFRRPLDAVLCGALLLLTALPAAAADPGTPVPDTSAASDNRAGSVLVFPLFTSSVSTPNTQNASLSLTNTDATAVQVRVFFVDGTSGAITQQTVALPANGTTTVDATDLAPGLRGYVIAVAADAVTGCPISYNHLIGDVDVKLATGQMASLSATAVAALYSGTLSGCTTGYGTMHFDGVEYTLLPRVLAVDSVASRADGNDTRLVLDHVGGDLTNGLTALGAGSGSLFSDTTTEYPFTFSAPAQLFNTLNNAFPALSGTTFETVVPAGRTGWMKAYVTADAAMAGAVLNVNANAPTSASAFDGGHNLHILTLGSDALALNVASTSTATATATATVTATATATATQTATATASATATPTREPLGSQCTSPTECASGFCVDAVCCNSACDRPDFACNLSGSEGMCHPLPARAPTLSPRALLVAFAALIGVGLLSLWRRRSS